MADLPALGRHDGMDTTTATASANIADEIVPCFLLKLPDELLLRILEPLVKGTEQLPQMFPGGGVRRPLATGFGKWGMTHTVSSWEISLSTVCHRFRPNVFAAVYGQNELLLNAETEPFPTVTQPTTGTQQSKLRFGRFEAVDFAPGGQRIATGEAQYSIPWPPRSIMPYIREVRVSLHFPCDRHNYGSAYRKRRNGQNYTIYGDDDYDDPCNNWLEPVRIMVETLPQARSFKVSVGPAPPPRPFYYPPVVGPPKCNAWILNQLQRNEKVKKALEDGRLQLQLIDWEKPRVVERAELLATRTTSRALPSFA
ncbi:hypothetical protein LTR36_004854 [Oleoguttula mirabilis]|uniref:F-box domain-containing protein n=1 Tax=Oleoguttula mirabilis TaxID=1507867 RepID=A0AAV9JF43_9PEZI|nr:hypothetical protein LTR36_004854 [Oleoguttula mirabilis]